MLLNRLALSAQIIRTPAMAMSMRSAARLFSTIRPVSPMATLRSSARSSQLETPTFSPILSSVSAVAPASTSIFSNLIGGQRRWKSRGNTFQPNTYKRKQRSGFLARMRSPSGRKIIKHRKAKGRWYLTY